MSHYDRERAQEAYDLIYGGHHHRHHEVTHELLAAAAGFEAMRLYEHHLQREGLRPHHQLAKERLAGFAAAEIDKHFERGHYGHLNHREARLAHAQAEYLWREQHGGGRW
jgi:hypothetical protein